MKSVENFSQQSEYNEMLSGLKYFERAILPDGKTQYKPKSAYDWGEIDRTSLANCLIRLCQQAKQIFLTEARLIELSSPVYILGTFFSFSVSNVIKIKDKNQMVFLDCIRRHSR
jgi:hypothetical protein